MATNYDYQRECLNYLTGTGGPMHALVPHLYTNVVTPTPNTSLTDLTEATFDGYAAGAAVTWGAAYVNESSGQAEIAALVSPFIATDGTITQSVTGLYLETPAAGSPLSNSLAMSANFASAVPITRTGDGVSCTLIYRYDGTFVVNTN